MSNDNDEYEDELMIIIIMKQMDGELNVWLSASAVGFDHGNLSLTNFYFHSPEFIGFIFAPANEKLRTIHFYDDIYSLGIFIYELIANRIPFSRLFQSPAAAGSFFFFSFFQHFFNLFLYFFIKINCNTLIRLLLFLLLLLFAVIFYY